MKHPLYKEFLELQIKLFKETLRDIGLKHGFQSEKAMNFNQRLEDLVMKYEKSQR